ncbi:hypothetical protein [Nocardia anaemiae]|uniref:hypothetical protein n=1 Tax=Nocardia anaemiae TaxID=263910 RepID=UPI0007A4FEEF|nr:hypothetical protein [Nocardia anaemiae]
MQMHQTSGAEVVRLFTNSGRTASTALKTWRRRPGREYVAEKVLAHVTTAAYTVASEDISQLATPHSLGSISRRQAQKIASIRDWNPDFAFTHLFHFALEDLGGVFTWDQFQQWSRQPHVQPWLWVPAHAAVERAREQGFTYPQARDAMRWRIGIAYYSFLRELYVIAALRERGLPMRCHPLADALFRIDAWCDDVLLELFISNNTFRAGTAHPTGRKPGVSAYFSDQPRFKMVSYEMQPQRIYGRVHLPSPAQVDGCATTIRQALAAPAIGDGGR